ncbi:MAG: PilZ domain-containing protein [Hydrogenovibrio sp.]|nr:PilZ domain-containing protein [Hydrogenovibrio sp.]
MSKEMDSIGTIQPSLEESSIHHSANTFSTKQPFHEKRRTVRVASNRPVVMKINDSTIFATMTDFSKHGLGFIAMCDVHKDDIVEVHFDIPYNGGFKTFLFEAQVRHCIDLFEKHHIGVRLNIDENEYSQLFDKIVEV